MKSKIFAEALSLLLLTGIAIAIAGYHLGTEDQAIYLPAIEKALNPSLFPHDAELFLAQTRPTLFPQIIAALVRATHLPLGWLIFPAQLLAIFFLLAGCLRMSRLLFESAAAQWAGVAMIAVMLTLPVAGTALAIADQDLHPRTPATALLLFMLADVLERKWSRAILFFALAVVFHLQMAFYGALLAIFLLLPHRWFVSSAESDMRREQEQHPQLAKVGAVLFPLASLFEPPTSAWHEAIQTRWQLSLAQWPWYCWLGIFAPLALLMWFSRLASQLNLSRLRAVSIRLAWYGIFIFVVAVLTTIPHSLERLRAYQPMRGFHLLYIFLLLIAGGLLAEFFLERRAWRWFLLFLPLGATMFFVQRQVYAASPGIERPGASPRNPWLQAFEWIKQNTPPDAYFALDPYYMQRPQEDMHGFRALAEHSMMADAVKDSGVALLFPAIAPRWQREVHARDGWSQFHKSDFENLHREFGVDWVVIDRAHPGAAELNCPYHNQLLAVCKLE